MSTILARYTRLSKHERVFSRVWPSVLFIVMPARLQRIVSRALTTRRRVEDDDIYERAITRCARHADTSHACALNCAHVPVAVHVRCVCVRACECVRVCALTKTASLSGRDTPAGRCMSSSATPRRRRRCFRRRRRRRRRHHRR